MIINVNGDALVFTCSVPNLGRFTDPDELARKHAVSCWGDWGGESVMYALMDEGVLPVDESEAREMLSDWDEWVIDYYLCGHREPFDPSTVE